MSSTADALARAYRGVQEERRQLALLVVLALAVGALEAVAMTAVLALAGVVAQGRPVEVDVAGTALQLELVPAAAIAVVAIVARAACALMQAWCTQDLSERATQRLRSHLLRAFLGSQPQLASHDELQTLTTIHVVNSRSLFTELAHLVSSALIAAVLLAAGLWADPIATVTLGACALAGLPLLHGLSARGAQHSRAARDHVAALSHAVSEAGLFRREAHAFGVAERVREDLEGHLELARHSLTRAHFIIQAVPLLFVNVALLMFVGALVGAQSLGRSSPATIAAVVCVIRALQAARRVQGSLSRIVGLAPFLELVQDQIEALEARPLVSGDRAPDRIDELALAGASFAYAGAPDRPVLREVDLTVRRGRIVGLVGPSGAGKSTLIGLLLREHEPTAGQLLVDGAPACQLDRVAYARQVGFVPQECHLLTSSIADNIRFFRPDLDRSAIEQAAREAGIHDEILGFPAGYETPAGDLGSRLSGGQRQRLVFARALAGRPSVLILDEPTSALDERSETIVRDAVLSARERGCAVLVVAHRSSTIAMCDEVVELRGGRAVTPPR